MNELVSQSVPYEMLRDYGAYPDFPPKDWEIIRTWGDGYCLREPGGLRVIVDLATKLDGHLWLHLSASRKKYLPSWGDLKRVKQDFIGSKRAAIMVFPMLDDFVNIHPNCHHLWHCVDGETCPNFTGDIDGVKSI